MKNLITTPWIEGYGGIKQARVYLTQGSKIAIQIVNGYGQIDSDGNPAFTARNEPRYYQTVLGAFDSLESSGFGDVVTVDQVKGVLNL